jgi:hypothetical protein
MWIWSTRLQFAPERALEQMLPNRLVEIDGSAVTNLSDSCVRLASSNSWILFVMNARFTSDATFRTFFETARESVGLWVEYDAGLVRLGLGLGPESVEPSTSVPIRIVRRDESATVLIGVVRDQTRVITDGIDARASWPGPFAESWSCDSVQIGSDERELSEGNDCDLCDVRLRYATGANPEELQQLLNSVANVNSMNARRTLGTFLTLLGLLVLFFGARVRLSEILLKFRRLLKRLNTRQRSST